MKLRGVAAGLIIGHAAACRTPVQPAATHDARPSPADAVAPRNPHVTAPLDAPHISHDAAPSASATVDAAPANRTPPADAPARTPPQALTPPTASRSAFCEAWATPSTGAMLSARSPFNLDTSLSRLFVIVDAEASPENVTATAGLAVALHLDDHVLFATPDAFAPVRAALYLADGRTLPLAQLERTSHGATLWQAEGLAPLGELAAWPLELLGRPTEAQRLRLGISVMPEVTAIGALALVPRLLALHVGLPQLRTQHPQVVTVDMDGELVAVGKTHASPRAWLLTFERLRPWLTCGKAYLGATAFAVTKAERTRLHLQPAHGVRLGALAAGGPAALAGLVNDDIIMRWDDQPVTPETLRDLLGTSVPGQIARAIVLRNGHPRLVALTLAASPAEAPLAAPPSNVTTTDQAAAERAASPTGP